MFVRKSREKGVEEGFVLFTGDLIDLAFLFFIHGGESYRIDVAPCAVSISRLKHLHQALVLGSEKGSEELCVVLWLC